MTEPRITPEQEARLREYLAWGFESSPPTQDDVRGALAELAALRARCATIQAALDSYMADPVNADDRAESWRRLGVLLDNCDQNGDRDALLALVQRGVEAGMYVGPGRRSGSEAIARRVLEGK